MKPSAFKSGRLEGHALAHGLHDIMAVDAMAGSCEPTVLPTLQNGPLA